MHRNRLVNICKFMNENFAAMSSKTMVENQPSILIIGAGAAGIAAASRLVKNGFENVTVLEAADRIGGRIHSVKFGESMVDLGAQWVHGEKGNIIYDLAKDLNVLGSSNKSNYEEFSFFTSDGVKVNQNVANRLYEIAADILEDVKSFCEHGGVMRDYFEKYYKDKVLSEFGPENKEVIHLSELLEDWISKFVLCLDPAESWDQIHCEGFEKYEYCEGNPLLHWKDRGYSTILDILLEKFPSKTKSTTLDDKICLNKFVMRLNWKSNTENGKRVSAHCLDGSEYHADHVLVTLSVALLTNFYKDTLSPQPPVEKLEAAQKMPLGNVVKVFLKFPEKWWPDNECSFSFLWTQEGKREIRKCFPTTYRNGRSWLEDLFGLYSVECESRTLLGWFVGPMTKEIEQVDIDLLQFFCMQVVDKFLGQKYKIPEPESILRSNWGTNPLFGGAYSYVGPETTDSDEIRRILSEPLYFDDKPIVLFAGEALHQKHFSTVHGAIETGFREADRLIKMYRSPQVYKVVIVGAGMAGLGAATRLMQDNIEDFLVLEAQDKAGGRIHTILVDNKPLDLGAQWLHGKHNSLFDLAVKHDLLADEMSEEGLGLYVRSNGEIVEPFTVERTTFEVGKILQECESFLGTAAYPSSLGSFLQEKMDSYINKQDPNSNELKELYDWHVRFQVIDNSCLTLSNLSAKSWGEYECVDDAAHYNLKHGYQSLVDVIVDGLPKCCIKYNSEVTDIAFQDDNRIVLQLSNNQTIICDHLILTPSLGILKLCDGLSKILPDDLMQNVENMGFAAICKIYLFYEEKWWMDSKGFQLLWTEDCGFSEKESWLRHVTGFDEVFNHPNALMTWVGGAAVQEVEKLPTNTIGKQCTEVLQKFLPNYNVTTPTKIIRTKWLDNPFVRGSYCHITPECDRTDCGIRQLGRPVMVDGVPRIVLAGEAVHPSHFSTTHGAFESGQEQAQVLGAHISAVSP